MSEKERVMLEKIAHLPEALQDRLLAMVQGMELAIDAMKVPAEGLHESR